MEFMLGDAEEFKINYESDKQMCRCCLTTDKRMKSSVDYQHYFMDLAGINVSVSDGVPQWVCWECGALMRKAYEFKFKMVRAHTVLYEYLTRCAPFPIEPSDPELSCYASPQLNTTHTLSFDSTRPRNGFHKVLQLEKRVIKCELSGLSPPAPPAPLPPLPAITVEVVKDELTDCEDNLPLEEFRSSNKEDVEGTEDLNNEPEVKRKKKVKEPKSKKKKIKRAEGAPGRGCSGGRKPLELDPDKIRVITLDPEEQVKQREEESQSRVRFPFQCALCFKGFNFEHKLQNHMTKHSPSRGQYECKLCSMFLPTVYSYSVHTLIHTRRYECAKCGLRMIDRASILHHYRTQHEGITTVITCDLCGKVSSNSKTHRGHLRNHHSGERPKCDQCGKSFINKDSLTEHMQIHEGVKNYECSVCGKRSRTRTQMKHHQLTHTDLKQYYCVECDARFKSAHSLRQHLTKSLKHKDVATLMFPCERCDKRFETAAARYTHVRVQHDGVRAFPCGQCGAALASRASRDKHARRHASAPPPPRHVCDTCGKAFRGKSVLTNHLRTHTGEKPFLCALCGRGFSQRTARATHVKLVHLKLRRAKSTKEAPAPAGPAPAPPAKPELFPKDEPQVVYDSWSRACDVFYVTAGP